MSALYIVHASDILNINIPQTIITPVTTTDIYIYISNMPPTDWIYWDNHRVDCILT